MELTQEQMQKIQQKLPVAKVCPNCGCTEEKLIDPYIFDLLSYDFQNDSINFGGKMVSHRLLSVRCPKCSFTSLFNLKALGVL